MRSIQHVEDSAGYKPVPFTLAPSRSGKVISSNVCNVLHIFCGTLEQVSCFCRQALTMRGQIGYQLCNYSDSAGLHHSWDSLRGPSRGPARGCHLPDGRGLWRAAERPLFASRGRWADAAVVVGTLTRHCICRGDQDGDGVHGGGGWLGSTAAHAPQAPSFLLRYGG